MSLEDIKTITGNRLKGTIKPNVLQAEGRVLFINGHKVPDSLFGLGYKSINEQQTTEMMHEVNESHTNLMSNDTFVQNARIKESAFENWLESQANRR